MFRIAIVLLLAITSCGPRTEPFRTAPRPDAPGYGSALPAGHTAYDNAGLADIFVRLTHDYENGDVRPGLQRFEGPINIGMTGPGSDDYRGFLGELVDEIAQRTGAPVALGAAPHDLLIRFVPGEEFIPWTINQCFVTFGQPDWAAYRANPDDYDGDDLTEPVAQAATGIFIPDTIEPYKIRECLLEEITQALGTANDLYGLASSIFNDDNAHSWPTSLDYLMLRVLYDARLTSGLSKDETRARALTVLNDINPEGRSAQPLPAIRQTDFRDIRKDMHGLLHQNASLERRHTTIKRLARQTRARFPDSLYECTIADILAGVAHSVEDAETAALLDGARTVCEKVVGADDIRIALLRLDQAGLDLTEKRYRRARDEAERLIPIFMAHGQESKVAEASLLRLVAAYRLDDPKWEDEYLEHAERWSAYAYGDDNDLTQKLRP